MPRTPGKSRARVCASRTRAHTYARGQARSTGGPRTSLLWYVFGVPRMIKVPAGGTHAALFLYKRNRIIRKMAVVLFRYVSVLIIDDFL